MARYLVSRVEMEQLPSGNEMVAAEFLWGAFAHCLIAVAQNEGLPHDSHGAFGNIAKELAAKQHLPRWQSDFGAAENLHTHFYHGNLNTEHLRTHRDATARAVQHLLGMLRAEL